MLRRQPLPEEVAELRGRLTRAQDAYDGAIIRSGGTVHMDPLEVYVGGDLFTEEVVLASEIERLLEVWEKDLPPAPPPKWIGRQPRERK